MKELIAKVLQFFTPKQFPAELYLTLEFDQDMVSAQIFELSGKQVTVLGSVQKYFNQDSWEEALKAVNLAVTEIESFCPSIKKTIFGIPNVWVEEEKIKSQYQTFLKTVSTNLNLKPVGFVILQDAIIYYLNQLEGVPATAILINVLSSAVNVCVVRSGKIFGIVRKPFTSNIAEAVKTALKEFIGVEIFPSRILIYGFRSDLEEIKQELLSFPWLQNIDFLHFPKIEILSNFKDTVTMSYAGVIKVDRKNTTLLKKNELVHKNALLDDVVNTIPDVAVEEKHPEIKMPETDGLINKNASSDLKELGFVQGMDILENADNFESVENDFDLVGHTQGIKQNESNTNLPAIKNKLTIENFFKKIPQKIKIPKIRIIMPIVFSKIIAGLLRRGSGVSSFFKKSDNNRRPLRFLLVIFFSAVVLGLMSFIYLQLLKTEVVLSLETKNLEKNFEVLVSETQLLPDDAKHVVPGRVQEITEKGELSAFSTGTKVTGEKAKGYVVVYNKTNSTKFFPAETVAVNDSYKFTFDQDASVSAQTISEATGGATISYGKQKVSVTAASFGSKYNLRENSTFKITDLPLSSFEAKNEQQFVGGTSRDITVVSKEDHENVLKTLSTSLMEKARKNLADKNTDALNLLPGSIEAKIISKKFSKDIDAEGKEFSLSLELKFTGLAYLEKDLFSYLEKILQTDIPSGFIFDQKDVRSEVEELEVKKDGSVLIKVKSKIKLNPKIFPEEIRNNLAGKKLDMGKKYLLQIKNVQISELKFSPGIPAFLQFFPVNKNNISVILIAN